MHVCISQFAMIFLDLYIVTITLVWCVGYFIVLYVLYGYILLAVSVCLLVLQTTVAPTWKAGDKAGQVEEAKEGSGLGG